MVQIARVTSAFRIAAITMVALFALHATGAVKAFADSDPSSERCGEASEGYSKRCADGCSDDAAVSSEGTDNTTDRCAEEEGCPDGDAKGGCAPGCQLCECCGLSVRTLFPQPKQVLPVLSVFQLAVIQGDRFPSSPYPHDILHVPRPTLA